MFVACKDLRFARGRFALMGVVTTLIALLVGLLSGLTAGLGRENTQAITSLPADRLVFAAAPDGESVSFADSRLEKTTLTAWRSAPGVISADPLGIAMTRAEAGAVNRAVAAFGVTPGSPLAPDAKLDSRQAVLSQRAADELRLTVGDTFRLGARQLIVSGIAEGSMFSHTPVVWTSLDVWQPLASPRAVEVGRDDQAGDQATEADDPPVATVIALRVDSSASPDIGAVDRRLGTRTVTVEDSLAAIGSYTAENGSLQLMRGFLFLISALVIGAFFTVWTIQRSTDIAVLKALGASTGYLLRDAVGQAVVLLVLGTGVGTALAALAGVALGDTVPFVLEPATVLFPALTMTALGLLGAVLAVRRVTAVDPLTALGSAR
ncbi:ABC transporter permease [Streptomyces alkaliterrae]|uniref:FtsX-like permease family protein n=1 Tax=Streptomyces alkaliterrae TaxID=2213162 RepID=A0A5P0YSH4_9ACTN|nr:ABC transporter permease [Streptomyces alkaliterrae]MBB1253449.1 FtsX-like permease family protein [Streptomyces alkaliterrae]MBB1259415.1 FtsX-like permease family protein [Streptomyces alkaliterrae]MQS03266.1 FtsX-like permease family protein [Streptomyces alkaliterrae]